MEKIMIAVPCMDTLPVQFVESLMYMIKPLGTSVCFKANSLIYDARNLLSLTAIERGFDYVLWLDSDMVVPHDTLRVMMDDLATNPGYAMVTGLYVKRAIPSGPVLFDHVGPPEEENGHFRKIVHNYTNYPRDSVFPVEGCGFGCVLTSVKLLKEVWDKFGPAFAPFAWAGEDVSFCHRVNQLGHTILCDSRVKCGHVGNFIYTEALLGGGNVEEN